VIRIVTADEPTHTVITVDGPLSGDCLETVETCCYQAVAKGKPVRFVLRDVSGIDEMAVDSFAVSPQKV